MNTARQPYDIQPAHDSRDSRDSRHQLYNTTTFCTTSPVLHRHDQPQSYDDIQDNTNNYEDVQNDSTFINHVALYDDRPRGTPSILV